MRAPRAIGALVLGAAFVGCSAPVPGDVSGDIPRDSGTRRLYALPVGAVWDAVERSLAELHYTPEDDRHDDGGGILHARRDDVGGLSVSAFPFSDSTTVVSVAADAANREAEAEVFSRLDARLGPPPPGRAVPTSFRPGR